MSEAEKVACQLLPEGDIIINVVDATNLERNLNLTLQLLEMNKPVVVVLNMWDDTVHKGISIDPEKLSKMLGVPVVTTTGITGEGIDKLIEYIMNYPPESVTKREYKNRWAAIGEIINAVQNLEHRRHTFLERLQDISIHPFYGIPIAILVIIAIFRVIIGIGEYLIGLMEQLFERFYTCLLYTSFYIGFIKFRLFSRISIFASDSRKSSPSMLTCTGLGLFISSERHCLINTSFICICVPFINLGKNRSNFSLLISFIMQKSINPSSGTAFGAGIIPPP